MTETIETLLKAWDGEELVLRYDRPTGTWIIIAIHSTKLGPAGGGTRMKPYDKLEDAVKDALRLAGGMTHKYASVDFAYGGAKAVLAVPRDLDPASRPDLLRRYGSLINDLGGLFTTGPDVGTTSADMDTIGETAGKRALCQDPAKGGAGDPGPFTALGVFEGLRCTVRHAFDGDDVASKRVLVQGAGDVGGPLIEMLVEAGAQVLVSDVAEPRLARWRAAGLEIVDPAAVFDTECDVFVPCALGAILNHESIPRLRCRAVAGSANNQLDVPEDARRLQERNILYAPDYIINAGGAISIWGIEVTGWSPDEARAQVVRRIVSALETSFETAEREAITTDEAAQRIVDARLKL